MNAAHWTALLSAVLGAAGTIILFFNSWTLQPHAGTFLSGPNRQADNARTNARNRRMVLWQKFGLVLLCLSFAAQGIAVFLA